MRPAADAGCRMSGADAGSGEISAFYKKRISRVFWPFLIWSVIYNLFPWFTGLLGLNPEIILDFFPYSGEEAARQSLNVSLGYIAKMPLNFSLLDVHMWYIYLLIGLYPVSYTHLMSPRYLYQ